MRLLEEEQHSKTTPRAPEIVCIGGGKGGVGKTCLSVNLSIEIAHKGYRVILFDADLSCSNIETVLGVKTEAKLDDFFHQKGSKKDLSRILCETQYDNLRLIPGTTGLLDVANPRYQQKTALIRELRELDADLIVIDLDAGAHLNTLDFFLMTEGNGILVVAPEKTSIDNAFKFLRAALFRKLERFYQSPEVGLLLKRNESLRDFLTTVKKSPLFDDATRKRICGEIVAIARSICPRVVVNRVRNAYEAQIAANIFIKQARQELMVEASNLGHLYFDKCVPEAVNSGMPFIVSHPRLKISACITDIANRLGYV